MVRKIESVKMAVVVQVTVSHPSMICTSSCDRRVVASIDACMIGICCRVLELNVFVNFLFLCGEST